MNSSRTAENVYAYIARAPVEAREKLILLRTAFKNAAPQAEEVISYHMPYYYYHGPLGGFAAYKKHVTLFGSFPDDLQTELKQFKTGRGSVQFPLDKPLPVPLISKLVKAHLKINEAGAAEDSKL